MKDVKINISTAGFPSQFVSDADKASDEYGLMVGQAIQYEWFKNEGVRRAYVGEETLIEFMRTWANVGRDGECAIDDIKAVTSGNVTELKQYVTALKDNRVRLLLGVKDEKYQQVYTRFFGREKPKRDDLFVKSLNADYGEFRADFDPNDLTLKRWEPGLVQPTETAAEPVGDVSSDWI